MKKTPKKNYRLPISVTWGYDNGKISSPLFYDIALRKDLEEFRKEAKRSYVERIEFPEGSLNELIQFVTSGSPVKDRIRNLPMPEPGSKTNWQRVGIPPITELRDGFPGMKITDIHLWRSDPPRGKNKQIAPKGFEVMVVRDEWEDLARPFHRLRIRTRQTLRPIPVRALQQIATNFLGDREFWFDVEQTNYTDRADSNFYRYSFISLASDDASLNDLLRNGSTFLSLIRTLSNAKGGKPSVSEYKTESL